MRVFVAGATGVLGLPATRALAAAGHDVVGLVRSPEKKALVAAVGAVPAVGDVLDPGSLRHAIAGAEAVVHLAASDDAFERVRVEGGRNLVAAAQAAGARRFVVGSGYWIYGDHAEAITEASAIRERGPGRVNYAAEQAAMAANRPGDFDVVVARPGMVYGLGGWFARMVEDLKAGAFRYVGTGRNRWSPAHPADVGEGFRAVVERGEPGGTYLIVDDAPVPVREFASYVAERLGAPRPRGLPLPVAAKRLGSDRAAAWSANQAALNARLKSLGWRPRFPTHREGVPDVLRAP